MDRDTVKTRLQMGLNRRLYQNGHITYDMYARTLEILSASLTEKDKCGIIHHRQ